MSGTPIMSLTPITLDGRSGGEVLLSVDAQAKFVGRVASALYRMSNRNIHDLSLALFAFTGGDTAVEGLAAAIVGAVHDEVARRRGGGPNGVLSQDKHPEN